MIASEHESYSSPTLEEVEVAVEQGYANSQFGDDNTSGKELGWIDYIDEL